jgi:hypothetical protein
MIIDCLEDPNAVVAGNIIVGNEALYGGGIRIQNSDGAILANNTIAFNRASWKGIGIYGEGNHAVNSILWGHGGGVDQDLYDCTAAYSCIESGVPGTQNIATDPCFIDAGYWDDAGSPGDLTDDFFVTGDYHLQGDSGCVDAADISALPESLALDIDGETRIFNGAVDIGPDEVVTSQSDFNEDGAVDSLDLSIFAGDWLVQGQGLLTDMDETGIVDWGDFVVFSAEWGWLAGWRQ